MLTGVYLSELCLIGLFGARKAPGPSILLVILLVATILYHILLNQILRSAKMNLALREDGELAPLLPAEDNVAEPDAGQPLRSKRAQIGLTMLPLSVSEPIASLVESYIASSQSLFRSWMNDPAGRGDEEEEEEIQYTEEEVAKAYQNPALTSQTPKLWLVKDEVGISEQQMEENEAVGIATTNQGASLDARNHIVWEQGDLSRIPIAKKPVEY
jgi:calcium permeable stress-gated cation channel